MTAAYTVEDREAACLLLHELLHGAGFVTFTFGCNFSLCFGRMPRSVGGIGLPPEVRLELEAEWWFGERRGWEEKVLAMAPPGHVEPAEPVRAFELATLRWQEGAEIAQVGVEEGLLRLRFGNGRVLSALCHTEMGWGWSVQGSFGGASWSVVAEDDVLYAASPLEDVGAALRREG